MSSNGPPVNLKYICQTHQDDVWLSLNANLPGGVKGHEGFHPVTIKAAYVIELIYQMFEGAESLIRDSASSSVKFLSALGVVASAIELLGKCLQGSEEPWADSPDCLKSGLRWLLKPDLSRTSGTGQDSPFTVTSKSTTYTIDDLMKLRNFSAHGQATTGETNLPWTLDPELLIEFPNKMGDGINHYWAIIAWPDNLKDNPGPHWPDDPDQIDQLSRTYCQRIANVKIVAVHAAQPILKSWVKFESQSAGDEFYNLDFEVPK